MTSTRDKGIVYLVGAGPGDPGLITVRGLECLRSAEVVVYDYLANPRLLEALPEGCERIYAGKQANRHTLAQDEINALLVEKCRQGKRVVRLKGGDPFVFGRGGEEALALREAGLRFEVVPGVTAGVAAAAYAGIPVTHRGLTSTLAFVTGHEKPDKESADIDWEPLAKGFGTVVFYMGVGNLPMIAERLRAHGRSDSTPVAVVRWGTWPRQETVTGTLADIAEKVEAAGLKPPAVIVVGEVVALREQLNWFERRPLFGRRIVTTRSRAQAGDLSRRLEELGAEAIEFPVIRTAPPEDPDPLRRAAAEAGSYDWLVFTSVNGVDAFFEALRGQGLDARSLAGTAICAIGPATATRVEKHGLIADLLPPKYIAESVAESLRALGAKERRGRDARDTAGETPALQDDMSALQDETPALPDETLALRGLRVLLPRSDIARSFLPEALEEMGAEVTEVVAYRTALEEPESVEEIREGLRDGTISAVTFTSSSTVRNFVRVVGEEAVRDLSDEVCLVSIGPETSRTLRQYTKGEIAEAAEYTIPGLVDLLVRRFAAPET
ncbi:MAG TPA: uroporphyrinogen-III C-methyltransferase [Sumerlaeia bacterium]|nr:uroporphyrinogen-III C-methyltransferase [Sumerlaeia bacterium]